MSCPAEPAPITYLGNALQVWLPGPDGTPLECLPVPGGPLLAVFQVPADKAGACQAMEACMRAWPLRPTGGNRGSALPSLPFDPLPVDPEPPLWEEDE